MNCLTAAYYQLFCSQGWIRIYRGRGNARARAVKISGWANAVWLWPVEEKSGMRPILSNFCFTSLVRDFAFLGYLCTVARALFTAFETYENW